MRKLMLAIMLVAFGLGTTCLAPRTADAIGINFDEKKKSKKKKKQSSGSGNTQTQN